MSRRVSLDALDFDAKITELAFSEDREEVAEKREKIRRIMAKIIKNDLTARQREIIVLYYYSGKGVTEIGEILKISPSTVSRTIKAARIRIYKYLKYYFM